MSQMNDRKRPSYLTIVRNRSRAEDAVVNDALAQVADAVPACVAAGLVDLRTGSMLGMKTVTKHPRPLLESVGAPLREAHTGLQALFLKPRASGDRRDRYFQEVLVLSNDLIHVFQRCKRDDLVLMTVCLSSANMRLVLTRSRLLLPTAERAVLGTL